MTHSTPSLPLLTVWHTDVGIALAITKPDAGPNDTAALVHLPIDFALSEFLPAVMAAINGYANRRNLADAVDEAIAAGSLDGAGRRHALAECQRCDLCSLVRPPLWADSRSPLWPPGTVRSSPESASKAPSRHFP